MNITIHELKNARAWNCKERNRWCLDLTDRNNSEVSLFMYEEDAKILKAAVESLFTPSVEVTK
jgi:hypothetical protein